MKSLVDKNQSEGMHSVVWKDTNNYDKKVVSGVYFYKLKVGNQKNCYEKVRSLKIDRGSK